MGLGSSHNTTTTGANYIPELWSNEVIAAYKRATVMRNLVTMINHQGKKGDTIHIPNFTRGSASAKAASTQVVLNTATHGVTDISINKHYEYSVLIEDILDVQGLPTLRQQYTDDAGYALAKQIDQNLHVLTSGFQGGAAPAAATLYETAVLGSDGSTTFSGAANTNTGNGADLTDVGLRRMIQTLDDQDVPNDGRSLVIPPSYKKVMLGIARFTEQAFRGDGTMLKTGVVGDVYGIPVVVSTNCPWVHVNSVTGTQTGNFLSTIPTGTTAATNGNADNYNYAVDWTTSTPTDTKYRVGCLVHKSSLALVEQMGIRSQTQYKQEYLGDLFTADTIYGVGELRDTSGICFIGSYEATAATT